MPWRLLVLGRCTTTISMEDILGGERETRGKPARQGALATGQRYWGLHRSLGQQQAMDEWQFAFSSSGDTVPKGTWFSDILCCQDEEVFVPWAKPKTWRYSSPTNLSRCSFRDLPVGICLKKAHWVRSDHMQKPLSWKWSRAKAFLKQGPCDVIHITQKQSPMIHIILMPHNMPNLYIFVLCRVIKFFLTFIICLFPWTSFSSDDWQLELSH